VVAASHHYGLRHNALIYESDDAYVERAEAFLKEGLDDGEAAVIAGTRDRLTLMREALGAETKGVAYFDTSSTYTRAARAIAAYYVTLRDSLREASAVRAVAEMQYSPTPAEWEQWAAYEAISNVAYAHLPAWVVCTYNAPRTPDRMLEAVWETHPEVMTDTWQESEHFHEPEQMVRRLTPEPKPLPDLRSVSPGEDLESFRERMAEELNAEDVPPAKAMDMLVAANEVASNALRHGSGIDELRVGRANGRFVCEISDPGAGFDDPLAGYMPPKDPGQSGPGLWIARQLSWRVEFFPAEDGFTVRLWL
jgi:anti-sigma regulatory factor (Ser/Thr protein kinase)